MKLKCGYFVCCFVCSTIQVGCAHFLVGPTFAKILGEDLFLSHADVPGAKRDELLLTGNINDILFPYLGQYTGQHGVRECSYKDETLFMVHPSQEFLANLKVEKDINEYDVVSDSEKVFA